MHLDASRVRRPSRRFGWVDRRIVFDGHLASLDEAETVVYLVLCVLADQHGLSWHPLSKLSAWTKQPADRVRRALAGLAQRGLLAIAGRLIQVLDLDLVVRPGPHAPKSPPADTESGRTDSRQRPRSPVTAPERLALLPTAVRDDLIEQARQKLARFTNGREPSRQVLEAVACGLIRDPAVRR